MKAIVLSRIIIDLDNRLVLQWDDKVPGRLWLYLRDTTAQYFEDENANELWRFYTGEPDPEKEPEKFTERGGWKE